MKLKDKISIFWFRRDLRLEDNHALSVALKGNFPVLPIFIFDDNILSELPKDDARVSFIYDTLQAINKTLNKYGNSLYCLKGKPEEVWSKLITELNIQAVYTNEDYEPYARERDTKVQAILTKKNIKLHLFKDQVIFAKKEVVKNDNKPYTVFTPYKKKWLSKFTDKDIEEYQVKNLDNLLKGEYTFPKIEELEFKKSKIKVLPYNLEAVNDYKNRRDFPAIDGTTNISTHLRFGTVSVRKILSKTLKNLDYVSELIWREFFMQILYNFPEVVNHNFKRKYDKIEWSNNVDDYEKWKQGKTGYPIVDAGMRQLNQTGYMHNRVRMIVASFLCKHLLIDWQWGELYFSEKLLDYELAANNGNWQWASSTGCDSVPYFRIFNPETQQKRFDPEFKYIRKWVPEYGTPSYPTPIVEHKYARERAITEYKKY